MLRRDEWGFIGQHNADYPDYFDMGDTSRSTGLMAMFGSQHDMQLLPLLVVPDVNGTLRLVRHPFDSQWSRTDLMSRDQVLCIAGAMCDSNAVRGALYNYAKQGWINKDILLPHHRYVLYKAAGFGIPWWIKMLGIPMLHLHVSYQEIVGGEPNQTLAMLNVHGDKKMYSNFRKHCLNDMYVYWSGHPWRDQYEIYGKFTEYVGPDEN